MPQPDPFSKTASPPRHLKAPGGEGRFRMLIEQNVDGIIIVGRDGNIRFVNPAAEALLGGTWVDLIGAQCGLPLTVGEPMEVTIPRHADDPILVEMRVVEIEWDHEPSFLASLRDITHRKLAEEERKRTELQMLYVQKLESLGILAGGIAHDFNNLLMTIVAHAGLASKKMAPESPGRDHILKIEQAALRGGELANEMLTYAGKGNPIIQTINLSRLVEEMGHLLAVSVSKRAILTYDLMQHIPPVHADPTQMRQVIMNLIMNASEAIGDRSGTITLRTGKMFVNQAYLDQCQVRGHMNDGECAYLEVQDTGSGMTQETLGKIFDPFFTTKFAGRGLGLAALLGIIRAHNGAIRVTSDFGHGTAFRIFLPCSPLVECADPEKARAAENWQGSGTVLVIDDEEDVRISAQLILEELGFHVLTAENGKRGLELFRAHHHEIRTVLLDLTMPHMSGEDLFKAMRNINPEIHVLLSSGYSEEEVLRRFPQQEGFTFIQKPYPVDALTQKIQALLAES